MDPNSRRSPVDLTAVTGSTTVDPPGSQDMKRDAAPLATLRQGLPTEKPILAQTPLKQQAIASGSRSDVKSATLARNDSRPDAALDAQKLAEALSRPIDSSRPVLDQLAQRGVMYRQHAQALGEAQPRLSAWQEALAIAHAIPDLSRVIQHLFGAQSSLPPTPGNLLAMNAQAQASLALSPLAPLPDGNAVVEQLVQAHAASPPVAGETAMQLRQRINGLGYHLDAIADLSDAPLRKDAPGVMLLRRLDALDKAIAGLSDDSSAPLPAPVRAHLARLGERVHAERGFALQAQAFARSYDTGNMNFEEITAHLRHGVTTDQLRFILFNQSVSAAFRGSFERGSPIPLPEEVRDSYDGLWQQLSQPLSTGKEAPAPAQDPGTGLASPQPPQGPAVLEDEPVYRDYIPEGAMPAKPE